MNENNQPQSQQQPSESALKVGDRVDRLVAGEWKIDYATVIYFRDGQAICEMNYPGHDGCRWAHAYDFDKIRKSVGR